MRAVPEPRVEPPTYSTTAGAYIANALTCDQCGALVGVHSTAQHTHWHVVNATLLYKLTTLLEKHGSIMRLIMHPIHAHDEESERKRRWLR